MRRSKRIFDLCFAIPGLILLVPLFLLIGAAIRNEDHGPVFFRQTRVGYRGRLFRIWKFRTMIVDAEQKGGLLTVGQDPRITKTGGWLRRYKLDELPQIINVISGEMSLVGPRPEVPRYVELYHPKQRTVLDLMPGITDPASIRYRDESTDLSGANEPVRHYIEKIMPEKIAINLDYARRASLLSDTMIIIQTLFPPAGK